MTKRPRHRCTAFFATVLMLTLFTAAWDREPSAQANKPRPQVKAVKVSVLDHGSHLPGMGSVRCSRGLNLGFDSQGTLSAVMVEEGDTVKKGQVLARLDTSVIQSQKNASKARIKSALAQLQYKKEENARRHELHSKSAISDLEMRKGFFELEKAQADLDAARADLAGLEAQEEKMTLKAPISGIIAERHMEAGETVTSGSHNVLRLIQCEEVDAEIELGERFYRQIIPGRTVRIKVDALPGKEYMAQVLRIKPKIDEKNRTFTVTVRMKNPEAALRQGMFVRAEISSQNPGSSLWVPEQAVLGTGRADTVVFVVKDGIALKRRIAVGERKDGKAEIISGLSEGDTVVVSGQEGLADLTEVSVSMIGEK
ncbi:MAG: efflux RND transporter periplasmic adaptor subunit [Pseudomonadota bacterium]